MNLHAHAEFGINKTTTLKHALWDSLVGFGLGVVLDLQSYLDTRDPEIESDESWDPQCALEPVKLGSFAMNAMNDAKLVLQLKGSNDELMVSLPKTQINFTEIERVSPLHFVT